MSNEITKERALFLAAGMVITGSFNTLSNKWADQTCAAGRYPDNITSSDSTCPEGEHVFDHPFVQSFAMFIGEFSCLLVFYLVICRNKSQGKPLELPNPGFNRWVMLMPAICDCLATSLMNIGLNLTYASVFQMLRGSVVIFTGIFSVIFLGRKLYCFHWVGMFFVLCGLALVGMSSMLWPTDDANAKNPTLGNLFVIMAQLVVAGQMVIEEKFVAGYNVPALLAVGLEGFFGFLIVAILVAAMYYVNAPEPLQAPGLNGRMEDVIDAVTMIGNSAAIAVALGGNVISIAFFNFFGISVTKEMSATTRMVLDSLRTVVIWLVCLALGWEKFLLKQGLLQIAGFIVLLSGTCIYNRIITIPAFMAGYNADQENAYQKGLLDEEGIDNVINRSTQGQVPRIEDNYNP